MFFEEIKQGYEKSWFGFLFSYTAFAKELSKNNTQEIELQRCFNASNWLTKWFFASCIADKGKRADFLQTINIVFGELDYEEPYAHTTTGDEVEHEEPYAKTTTGDEKDSFLTISQSIFCPQSKTDKTNVDKYASSDFSETLKEKPYHEGYRDSDTPHQSPR